MLLERIYDEDLAQAGYVIACQQAQEMLVVDPRRDIRVYLDLAARHGLEITHVTETHIHADYLSGTRELAAATGATVHVSGEGDADWQYGFAAERLHDGDTIGLGRITVQAVHTPGHTPEHLMFLVADGAVADEPGYALTGDFVFAGDLGRPDLLDEAAGGTDTRFRGAQQLFASLQRSFLTLPDHVQVLPGHGAGSACGKTLGSIPSSTVGYERRFAWWAPYLAADDRDGFVAELLDGQPDAHAYFGRMKRQNRDGPDVLGRRAPLVELSAAEVERAIEENRATLLDTRAVDAVHTGTVPGSLHVPAAGGRIASFGAWVVDPETGSTPLVLLAEDGDRAREIADHLLRVGIDDVRGYVTSLDGLPLHEPQTLTVAELRERGIGNGPEGRDPAVLLDVRSKAENAAGTIPGARQLSGGRVLWSLEELPREQPLITFCQSGLRSSVVASALRREGYSVTELEGSYLTWSAAHPDSSER